MWKYRRDQVEEESLLVVQELGVQLNTAYFNGRQRSKFLDLHTIGAVVLNEGISFFEVIFYMAFVIEGQPEMVLAFEVRAQPPPPRPLPRPSLTLHIRTPPAQHLRPRLDMLKPIYRGTRRGECAAVVWTGRAESERATVPHALVPPHAGLPCVTCSGFR
jgi:hypothetical protein